MSDTEAFLCVYCCRSNSWTVCATLFLFSLPALGEGLASLDAGNVCTC